MSDEGRIAYKQTHYPSVIIVNYKAKTPTVYKGLNVCVYTQSASTLIRITSLERFSTWYSNMSCLKYLLLMIVVSRNAASENQEKALKNSPVNIKQSSDDLKTASSSYSHQYSDWGGSAPGGYGFSVTGFGTIDDTNNLALKGYDFYDKSPKNYGYEGYNNLDYNDRAGLGGYEEYGVYNGHGGKISNGYIPNKFSPGYGPSGYIQNGFGPSGYSSGGFSSGGFGPAGYENSGYTGNGGYGGFGGNGGLASYSGYNNPYYRGGGHLGYGYYKKSGIGNIYSNGVTPSLVTGYRGYTRR